MNDAGPLIYDLKKHGVKKKKLQSIKFEGLNLENAQSQSSKNRKSSKLNIYFKFRLSLNV